MAPYSAIPRDYLSDTPLLRAMGVLVSQHGQLGAIPPPPFLSVSPLESMRSGDAIPPPPQKGYFSDTYAISYENRANGCVTPLCDTILKGYWRDMGRGISHWAAKLKTWHKTCGHRGKARASGVPSFGSRFLQGAPVPNIPLSPQAQPTGNNSVRIVSCNFVPGNY